MCVANTIDIKKIRQTQVEATVLGQKQTGAWDLKGQRQRQEQRKGQVLDKDKKRT